MLLKAHDLLLSVPQKVNLLVGFDEPLYHDDLNVPGASGLTRQAMSRTLALFESYRLHAIDKRAQEGDGKPHTFQLYFPVLSTHSNLETLSTRDSTYVSSRSLHKRLLVPFIAFPFDVHARALQEENKYSMTHLTDCCKLENLCLLGRPLYIFCLLLLM